jgi:hypothetical protein
MDKLELPAIQGRGAIYLIGRANHLCGEDFLDVVYHWRRSGGRKGGRAEETIYLG